MCTRLELSVKISADEPIIVDKDSVDSWNVIEGSLLKPLKSRKYW